MLAALIAGSSSVRELAGSRYGQCKIHDHTGTDYADKNISVKIGANNSFVCCQACQDYNAARTNNSQPKCVMGVWWRNALNYTGLCTLKATALQPRPRPLTAAMLIPPPPPSFVFSNIYTSDMVLQSAPAQATIWGFCDIGDTVTVSFNNAQTIKASTSNWRGDHVWKVLLPATEASVTQTHTITAKSAATGKTLQLTGVLFGDVWVCSGQSNMAYALSGSNSGSIVHPPVNNSAAEIRGMLNYPNLRFFRVGQGGNRLNLSVPSTQTANPGDGGSGADIVVDGWSKPCFNGTKESCRIDFSSMCYFFGRDVYEMLQQKRPIGLIGSYVGGTADELWSSEDALKKCIDLNIPSPTTEKAGFSSLWNSMIAPLTNTTIKGAVWYQGEADASHPGGRSYGYNCTFPAMIEDWRLKWAEGSDTEKSFPFGFVQLNSVSNGTVYDDPEDDSGGDPYSPKFGYGGIRWAQSAGYGFAPNPQMPNVFMAVCYDTPDRPYPVRFSQGTKLDPGFNVHSPFKAPAAARLARAALPVAYRVAVDTAGPLVAGATRQKVAAGGQKEVIVVSIKHVGAGAGVELHNTRGFEILAGGRWRSVAILSHTKDSVTITDVAGGTKLRYNWYSNPCGYDCFQCAVYVNVKPVAASLSGEEPFLPLPPFILDL